MSLIERIRREHMRASEAETAARSEQSQQQARIAEARDAVVLQHMKDFADREGTLVREMTPANGARYFVIGDIVTSVKTFGMADRTRFNSAARRDVLWQHYVSLVGIDLVGRSVECGRCALMTFRYSMIYDTITAHRDLEFDYRKVTHALLSPF